MPDLWAYAVNTVDWRVSTHIGPHGNVRERHAYRDLSGHIAEAICEQTAFTDRLEPDEDDARACPLCVLFVSVAIADQQQRDDREVNAMSGLVKICPDCNGSGKNKYGGTCGKCNGSGSVPAE